MKTNPNNFKKGPQEIPSIWLSENILQCLNCGKLRVFDKITRREKETAKFCNHKCYTDFVILLNRNNEKPCFRCKKVKSLIHFKRIKGQYYKRCLDCEKECQGKEKLNKIARDLGVSYATYLVGLNKENYIHNLVRTARRRAKSRERDFEIDYDFILNKYNEQLGICALSGINMTHTTMKGHCPTNISIDRIDSSLGYIKSNIQLICYQINIMKQVLGNKEFYEMCKGVVNTIEGKIL
jgi:hypothetical protein